MIKRIKNIKYKIYFNVSKKIAKCNRYKLLIYALIGIYI